MIKIVYLREVVTRLRFGTQRQLEIYEGDFLEEDKKHWMIHRNALSVRYFELKEKKLK